MNPPHEKNDDLGKENEESKVSIPDTPENGLTQQEAEMRLKTYGRNELEKKKENVFLKFLSYFWGPIPWMIEAAMLLSLFVQDWTNIWIISALLAANGLVGFWEEFQAGNAIAALESKLAVHARCKRDGAWKQIHAPELVPGDLIRLRPGDIVPADCAIRGANILQIDQSALTGESLPVDKKKDEKIFSGSIVKGGESEAVVIATGAKTYFAKTAKLVEEAVTSSHFQKALLRIGNYLIVIAIILVALIIVVALFRGDPFVTTLQFALILTVASIPVAMPTVLSVTMAVGARLLAAKQAIVSRLASIEELAGIDILCSDKTGTLTQNKLTLNEPYLIEPNEKKDVLVIAGLASRSENQDAIDDAVLRGIEDANALKAYDILDFKPFDPVHKKTEAKVRNKKNHQEFRVSKGAPQVILEMSENRSKVSEEAETIIKEFAKKGFRSLGVAKTDSKGSWQMLGILPLADPPREDSKETVKTAKAMGVKLKMLTGDQMAIAGEIAKQIGMGQNIMDASVFGEAKHHETGSQEEAIEKADGFAQVYPEHKYHIVDSLQKRGHIIGMTGDGVNDAPALKKADVGIAVSGATDAARAASDIVLTTPGLSIIIDAIKESRRIFQRMTSYAIYRIAETIRVLSFMTASILVVDFYPVTAVMIVLLAILNDGAILSIAYDKVRYSKDPEKWDMPIVLGISTVLGIAGVMASFLLFYLAENYWHLSRPVIQTLIYLKLSVAGHMTIFVTRTRGRFWSHHPAAVLFFAVLITQIIATLIAVYGIFMEPIGWKLAGIVWGYAFAWFLVNDQIKLAAYQIFDHAQSGFLGKQSTARGSMQKRKNK